MARSEEPKSEAGRDEREGIRIEGIMFSSTLAGGPSRAVISPSGFRVEAPATWRFKTFYRLTQPPLVTILLILIYFRDFFVVGSELLKISQPNFCAGPDPRALARSVSLLLLFRQY